MPTPPASTPSGATPAPERPSAPAGPRPLPEIVALRRSTGAITRTIRRRPVPRGPVQGTLALQWVLPGGAAAEPSPDHALRLMPRPGIPDDGTDPAVAQVPTARAELPDPGPWAAQLVQAVLEVLARERPRQQLVRWLSPEVYAELSAHVATGRVQPASGGSAGRARRTVSSLHVCEPVDGVVEASAVVLGGTRARAMALRLEGWDGRWRCTRLALL